MRRWFAILLLALLPLQFSWAAVASYCGHETGAQAQHLGHHEHQHADHSGLDPSGEAAGKDAAGNEAPLSSHFDCGHCHSNCCSVPAPAVLLTPLAIASHPATPVEGSLRTLAQTPPERPQWQRFA